MARAVQEVDHGTQRGRFLIVSLVGHPMHVDLVALTPVQIGNLQDHIGGPQQDVEQQDYAEMVYLPIYRQDPLVAVAVHVSRDEWLVLGKVPLQLRRGE